MERRGDEEDPEVNKENGACKIAEVADDEAREMEEDGFQTSRKTQRDPNQEEREKQSR
jgi:hypothetical protein